MASPWYAYGVTQGFHWTPATPKAHSGIDLGMPLGTPLTALLPGTIISAGMEPWGGQVNIQSSWPGIGPIVVSYLHASKLLAGAGASVKPGQIVALSGEPPSPQYGNGPHCHFEVSTGTQPPYMGHVGPSSPIDGGFLLDYAKRTNGGVAMGVPTGWRDDGKTLVAPNGHLVVLGFREYILGHAWDASNWPLTNEYYPQQLEPSDTSSGPGTRQDFEQFALLYPKTAPNPQVSVCHYGPDYRSLQAQIGTLTDKIAALEAQLGTTTDPGYVQFKDSIAALDAALTAYRSSK